MGFGELHIREAYERHQKSDCGEKTLLYNGKRVRHDALTNRKEFFAEMTEAYFGVIYSLLQDIWESPPKGKP